MWSENLELAKKKKSFFKCNNSYISLFLIGILHAKMQMCWWLVVWKPKHICILILFCFALFWLMWKSYTQVIALIHIIRKWIGARKALRFSFSLWSGASVTRLRNTAPFVYVFLLFSFWFRLWLLQQCSTEECSGVGPELPVTMRKTM